MNAKKKYPSIFYKGHKFTYRLGYYIRTERLHRRIWEDNYGEIPKDHHIHHKNGDMLDNRIENLECLHKSLHHSLHFDTEKQVAHLHKQRDKATKWHKSKEGRKWHSENSKRTWKKRIPRKRICTICGKEFFTLNFNGTKYCSQKCRSKSGYIKNKITVSCEICKKKFETAKRKRSARACSPQCGALLTAKIRRSRKRDTISST